MTQLTGPTPSGSPSFWSLASSAAACIGRAFGHLFQKLCDLVQPLLGLARKVDDSAARRFNSSDAVVDLALINQVWVSPPPRDTINVRDDGNCLFYSLALELIRRYPERAADRLEIAPPTLTDLGDLRRTRAVADRLAPMAHQLRQKAADYLSAHMEDEEVALSLMEGLPSHNNAIELNINAQRLLLDILLEDIRTLLGQAGYRSAIPATIELAALSQVIESLPPSDYQIQLRQKWHQFSQNQNQLAREEREMPRTPEEYIRLTRQEHIFCGTAQILALSRYLEIPITVLYNYDLPNETPQPFHQEAGGAALTIAHVNGNHFMAYVGNEARARPAAPFEPPP